MRKIVKKMCSIALGTMIFCTISSCGPNQEATEKIDNSRTQIYVYNYNGGFGAEWLTDIKNRYEALHSEDSYEEGKKGVQIYIKNDKSSIETIASSILDNKQEVYFTEHAYYYALKAAGVLGDITDAVVDETRYENKSVLSKLTDSQREYYGIEEADGKTHYYALPHYAGYCGLIYNVDLFEEKGFYLIDDPESVGEGELDLEDYFVWKDKNGEEKGKRSAGPDGEYGTDDDGLPTTYDEFFLLLDYIAAVATPVAWNGADYKGYLTDFLQALVCDHEGKEQMELNYNLNGSAEDLGNIENGSFVRDGDSVSVTPETGYELARQEGKYYALTFLEKLIDTDKYHNDLAFNSSYSHVNAQEDYVWAGHDGVTKPIAMLVDGVWWENEASEYFEEMSQEKVGMSKKERRFGFLPLPKATSEQAEENKFTLFDQIDSICFMKANVEGWKKDLILDFIKFCNTDESLVRFTQITGVPKAFTYSLTESEKEEMSFFGRSVIELKEKSDIVYPYSKTSEYVNNQSKFATHSMYQTEDWQYPAGAFHDLPGMTAEIYFEGMKAYYKDSWEIIIGR